MQNTPNIPKYIRDFGTNRENQKSIFFKKIDFELISVLWRFLWPAFGGPILLVYIYIMMYISLSLSLEGETPVRKRRLERPA